MSESKDVASKPSRAQIADALNEADRPDAEIDDDGDNIPGAEQVTKKRKREESESKESEKGSENEKKRKSSSSSSSSSSSTPGQAAPSGSKAKIVEDKKTDMPKSKASTPSSPKGRGRGRVGRGASGGPKLLDTSNVKPHVRPEVRQQVLDAGDMRDRNSAPAPKRGGRGRKKWKGKQESSVRDVTSSWKHFASHRHFPMDLIPENSPNSTNIRIWGKPWFWDRGPLESTCLKVLRSKGFERCSSGVDILFGVLPKFQRK